jgi:hypothetical protein
VTGIAARSPGIQIAIRGMQNFAFALMLQANSRLARLQLPSEPCSRRQVRVKAFVDVAQSEIRIMSVSAIN